MKRVFALLALEESADVLLGCVPLLFAKYEAEDENEDEYHDEKAGYTLWVLDEKTVPVAV